MTHRVAYFTDSGSYGGAERALLHLIRGLDRRLWKPTLLYHDSVGIYPLLARAADAGVELQAVPPMPPGHVGAARATRFAARLRRMRPAVFHAHLTWPLACKYALMAAALIRVPALVATAHLFVELPYDRASRIQQRILWQRPGRYIAVSHHLARRLHEVFGIPRRALRVVHNGVPMASRGCSPNPELRYRLTGSTERPLVLTCARLEQQKGLRYLLEAAALLPHVCFAVAGEGPEHGALEALAARLGVAERVRFLGHRDDVAQLLAASDVFVLPSLFEGLPLSILEAMAARRAVVATAVGGTPEVVRDEQTGLLVPPGDASSLARAIERLLRDSTLAERFAETAVQQVACEFSVSKMVAGVTAAYDELLQRYD